MTNVQHGKVQHEQRVTRSSTKQNELQKKNKHLNT